MTTSTRGAIVDAFTGRAVAVHFGALADSAEALESRALAVLASPHATDEARTQARRALGAISTASGRANVAPSKPRAAVHSPSVRRVPQPQPSRASSARASRESESAMSTAERNELERLRLEVLRRDIATIKAKLDGDEKPTREAIRKALQAVIDDEGSSDAEKAKAREALAFFLDDAEDERAKRDKDKLPVGRMNREEQALFDKSHPKASKGPVSARQIGAALQMPALCTPAQARARLAEMDREGRR